MPTYEYRCADCGDFTRYLPLARYNEEQHCPQCQLPARKMVSAPIVRGDIQPYQCPITGKAITSRRAHEENLLRHDCRVLERGERQEVEKRRKAEDDALANKLAETAAELVNKMPVEKQMKLAGELASSTGTTYNRA